MFVPSANLLRYGLWPDAERFFNDASVGGVDDQHVGLGPAQDVAGYRAKPLVAARAQSHVANHQ